MSAVTPAADLQNEFKALLDAAARDHAGDLHIRIEGDRAVVIETVRGEPKQVAEWPAVRCQSLLPAVFDLCDKAEGYVYGSVHSLRLTGERMRMPEGVSMVLVQFFAPKDGGRHLVCRLTYEGDICCGSCGG